MIYIFVFDLPYLYLTKIPTLKAKALMTNILVVVIFLPTIYWYIQILIKNQKNLSNYLNLLANHV